MTLSWKQLQIMKNVLPMKIRGGETSSWKQLQIMKNAHEDEIGADGGLMIKSDFKHD